MPDGVESTKGRAMKILRVLTGVHVGASLELTPGSHRIGSDEEADVYLSDWQGPDAALEVSSAELISISRGDPDSEQAEAVLLADFVPMQFDDLVLCIGPSDVAWPPDVDLLSTLLATPVKSQLASLRDQQRRRHKRIAVAACALLGCLVVAGALIGTTQLSRAAFPPSADERTVRVAQALAAAHVSGLHVQALGSSVVVTGIVATPNDDSAVRALLARVAPEGVERRYDVAQDDVRSLQDSIGIAGVHVSYGGNGRFLISGKVADMAQLRAAVVRVHSDMDANVKALVIQAEQIAAPDAPPATYSEMVASDDVRYAETPDGVKHIFAVDIPASAVDASASSPTAAGLPASSPAAAGVPTSSPAAAAAPAAASSASNPAQTAASASAPQLARGIPSYPPLPPRGSF